MRALREARDDTEANRLRRADRPDSGRHTRIWCWKCGPGTGAWRIRARVQPLVDIRSGRRAWRGARPVSKARPMPPSARPAYSSRRWKPAEFLLGHDHRIDLRACASRRRFIPLTEDSNFVSVQSRWRRRSARRSIIRRGTARTLDASCPVPYTISCSGGHQRPRCCSQEAVAWRSGSYRQEGMKIDAGDFERGYSSLGETRAPAGGYRQDRTASWSAASASSRA